MRLDGGVSIWDVCFVCKLVHKWCAYTAHNASIFQRGEWNGGAKKFQEKDYTSQ